MGRFTTEFLADFFVNIHKIEKDNWDVLRFSEDHPRRKSFMVGDAVSWMEAIISNINAYEEAYNLLEDEHSRKLMIKLLEYDVLDHHHVKLPLNTPEYWQVYNTIDERFLVEKDVFQHGPRSLNLYKDNATGIQFYGTPLGFLTMFVQKQYYLLRPPHIQPRPGDVCIDGGACRGEVAIHFAHSVGPEGEVHAFEFVPQNLDFFQKSLALNPTLAPRIKVCPKALWNESDIEMSFEDSGPSSRITNGNNQSATLSASTIAIDDYVAQENLNKVDFVKMDIEGAEIPALKGAAETIRKFKPKLAICVYHKKDDFYTIPGLIEQIQPGYKFYLDHYTIHREETVLYAHHVG